jgi:hypothetical protein
MLRGWLRILMLVVCLIPAALLPYHSDLGWIDPVTGSMKRQTRIFLVPVWTSVESSDLEKWIIGREGTYSNDWQFLHNTSTTLLHGRCHGCAHAPEIYHLHAGGMNSNFVRNASDAEIGEFVRIMRTGTSVEKEQAVQAACEKALDSLAQAD